VKDGRAQTYTAAQCIPRGGGGGGGDRGQVIICNDCPWTIVVNMFWECHTLCMSKTSFFRFWKRVEHSSCYKKNLNFSSLPNSIFFLTYIADTNLYLKPGQQCFYLPIQDEMRCFCTRLHTHNSCSLVPIGSVVLYETIKMWNVNDDRKPDCPSTDTKWWQ
jgi:hypothetical protein